MQGKRQPMTPEEIRRDARRRYEQLPEVQAAQKKKQREQEYARNRKNAHLIAEVCLFLITLLFSHFFSL